MHKLRQAMDDPRLLLVRQGLVDEGRAGELVMKLELIVSTMEGELNIVGSLCILESGSCELVPATRDHLPHSLAEGVGQFTASFWKFFWASFCQDMKGTLLVLSWSFSSCPFH